MLQHLYIRDLAIVSCLDINFSEGMTVITGETGAGKSIIVDALSLALGERSDSHLVRPGAEKAEIAATFNIASLPGAILWLTELELNGDDPSQQCIIRRILYANGRSKAFINGRPATTQQLRLLAEYLIQIHGQHQQQLLLKTSEQLRLLDAFGQHDEMVSQVKTAFKEWERHHLQLQALIREGDPEQSRIDLLQYQIAEIDVLQVGEGELKLLYLEHDQLAHAASYIQALESALLLLDQEEYNAISLVGQGLHALSPLIEKFPSLKNALECLNNAMIQLQEAVLEIQAVFGNLEINPQRLSAVAHRLEQIHDMARKHKVSPDKILPHFENLKAQLQTFFTREEKLDQLALELEIAANHYQHFASALSKKRKETAKKLGALVSQTIQQLGMPEAVFKAALVTNTDHVPRLSGNESVLFEIATNPGHSPQSLSKVVSGGELSRISLALELLTAQHVATPCLIFDEVDVGISGKTGAIVGNALYKLSKVAQILCVTHLPQVAACGDHHFQVTKTRFDQNTISEIRSLTEPERIEEIARMLGGLDVTTQARAHAKQMLREKETV